MSQDDELGAFLRSEVPEPRPGYWDGIEARLHQVEAETYSTRNRSLRPILAAAALAVIAATAGVIALTRSQPTVQIDTADLADSEQSTTDAPATDATADPDVTIDESVGPDLTVEAGSVWVTVGTDPIRGLLSPAGEPMEGQFSIYPLLATGEQAEAEDRVWIEMQAFREQPTTWYRADLLEKIADPLPGTEPSVAVFVGASPIVPRGIPGATFDVSETVRPGDALSSTGIRASADGVAWVLIDAELPFWITDESVTFVDSEGIEGFDRRQCFGDDEALLVLDFSADALSFTARFGYLDSFVLASGVRDNTANPVFTVDTSAIGSAEEVDGGIIVRERWEGTDDGITIADRGAFPLISCDAVAEEAAGLEAIIPDEVLLPIPS